MGARARRGASGSAPRTRHSACVTPAPAAYASLPALSDSPPHTRTHTQPSKNGTLLSGLYQSTTLKSLLASNTLDVATGHTFTVYTRNTGRQWIDNGPAGASPGDVVIASGNVFDSLAPSAPQVGIFDLAATVTSIAGSTERRHVNIEVSFFPGDVPFKAPVIAQATGNKTVNFANVAQASTSDLNLAGVVAYPAGGGVVVEPIVLAVIGGSGAFIGAKGQCTITFDAATSVFSYTFTLLKF